VSAWELINALTRLVLPPGGLIVLALLGLALIGSAPRLGRVLAAAALVVLYALSTPFVAGSLLSSIEVPYSDPTRDPTGQAIVVLSGGSYERAPEYGRDTVGRLTLERVRYAAFLQARVDKPVLVTGGNPRGAATSEAAQMREALRERGVAARWVEERSVNTLENARYSAELLRAAGIGRVYLVTHSWHLPRAILVFEHEGMEVIPAGTRYGSGHLRGVLDLIPSANALLDSWYYFHEIVGLAWYRLKLRLARTSASPGSAYGSAT
jgi:uncharacterized SAM-binding protein YcdF (DUF218 family)